MLLLGVVQAQASGGGIVPSSSFDLLQTEILTGSQASVVFSDLDIYAEAYQHFQIRMATKNSASGITYIRSRFNADSGNNYAVHFLWGNGSIVQSSALTSTSSFYASRSDSSPADNFNAAVVDILDPFETTKNTTTRSLFGGPAGTSPSEIYLTSGVWLNTSSITSIELLAEGAGNNLVTGSRFSLYGLKASV